jgi:rubredoxin
MSDNEGTYENKDNIFDDDNNFNLDQDDEHQLGFGGFNLNMGDGEMGENNVHLSCVGCGGTKFKIIEAHLVCKKCGTENVNHAINA